MQLHIIDWIIIVGYMVMLIVIGFSLRKEAGKSLTDYFLAGRSLPGWINGISYATTCMNADVAPVYCGITVSTGLFVGWWYIGRFGLAWMIGAFLFAAFWRRLGTFTTAEFYELRFTGKAAGIVRGWVSFRSTFISIVAWTGAGLLGMVKIAGPVLGFDKITTLAIAIPVALLYLFMSGYLGVVTTDVLQSILILVGSLVLMVAVLVDFGGPSGLGAALLAKWGPEVLSSLPPMKHELLSAFAVFIWIIGTSIGYGGDATPMGGAMEGQRILSCRNEREAVKMYIWAEITLFILLLALTLPALGAMVLWPGLRTGAIDRELAYGLLLKRYLPPGLLGLVFISIIASIMSTLDSNLNFGAQTFINDLYRRYIRPRETEKHYLRAGKIVMILIIVLALPIVWGTEYLFDIAVFMLGLSSAEMTANWAQWWWWRFNVQARIAASFGGPIIFLLVKFVFLPQTGYWYQVLTGMALTSALWITVAFLTPPDEEKVLVDFYRLARPLGFWGPIKDKALLP